MKLQKRELAELAHRGKVRWTPLRIASIVGFFLGQALPLSLIAIFSDETLVEVIRDFGDVELLFRILPRQLVCTVAAIAFCVVVTTVCRRQTSLGLRLTLSGGVATSVVTTIIVIMTSSSVYSWTQSGLYISSVDVLDGIVSLIIGPIFHGTWVGSIVGLATWLTLIRHGKGPLLGALGTAVFVAVLAGLVTLLIGGLTSPGVDEHGAGIGPGAGHGIAVLLVFYFAVLPVSFLVGGILGWFRHRNG